MARLLALVADLLATSGLLGAVSGVVSGLAAVVALHAVDALACLLISNPDQRSGEEIHTRHVAVTSARVAGLSSTTTIAAAVVVTIGLGLAAVAGNVTNLAALHDTR